jgi:predicted HTH transcriptional regulator
MLPALPISLDDLLHHRTVDSTRIEFKANWSNPTEAQVLKTICAFANDLYNQGSGYLIIGVEERDGAPVLPPRGLTPEQVDQVQKRVFELCRAHLMPDYLPQIIPARHGDVQVVVLWCHAGDLRPYRAPDLARKDSGKIPWVRTGSVTATPNEDQQRLLIEATARIPFDDRRHHTATLGDLSPLLLQQHLKETGSALATLDLDPATLYRNLHLTLRVNGHEVPRNVALLFFSHDPRRHLTGAWIQVAVFPDGTGGDRIEEKVHAGPLPEQLTSCLNQLRALNSNRILKNPEVAEALHTSVWPVAAVEEALVNAIYHRGYDSPEPVKVRIHPDRMEVVSYPGPVAGLRREDLQTGKPGPIVARNRRVGELLKERGIAEAHCTGLPKIRAAMRHNGSPEPEFDFDDDRTWFRVTLPKHHAFLPRGASLKPLPLRLGQPAPPDEVVGRDADVAEIWQALKYDDLVLIAPRGRGGSTVARKVAAEAPEGWATIVWDVAGLDLPGAMAALEQLVAEATGRDDPSSDSESSSPAIRRTLETWAGTHAGKQLLTVDGVAGGVGAGTLLAVIAGSVPTSCRLLVIAEDVGVLPDEVPLRRVVLMPLPRAHTHTLAARLLIGHGLTADQDTLDAIWECSAGLPELVTLLVAALEGLTEPKRNDVMNAYDEFLLDRRDPAGLTMRARRPTHDGRGNERDQSLFHLLDRLVYLRHGAPRVALVGDLASKYGGRRAVLMAIQAAFEEGILVERDGVIDFEHPVLREAWDAAYG